MEITRAQASERAERALLELEFVPRANIVGAIDIDNAVAVEKDCARSGHFNSFQNHTSSREQCSRGWMC
jgi:hypothetical protein